METEKVELDFEALEKSKSGRRFTVEPDVPVRCACDDFIPLTDFNPHPGNPNKHPTKQILLLADIIVGYEDKEGWHKGTGWRNAITVSMRPPHYITKGHGRYEAALSRNLKGAPVDYQYYDSEEQELADLIADNRIQEFSHLDLKLTKPILERLNTSGYTLRLTGYDGLRLKTLLQPEAVKEKTEHELVAEMGESYDYVLVFAKNDTDRDFLFNLLGLSREVSITSPGAMGTGHVVTFDRFIRTLIEHQELLTVVRTGLGKGKTNG